MAEIEASEGRALALDCLQCGSAFQAWRRGPGRYPRYCSNDCRKARVRALAEANRKKGPSAPRRRHACTCVVCDAAFATPNVLTKCCGPKCGLVLGKRVSDLARRANADARRALTCAFCLSPFREKRRSAKQIAAGQRQRFCSRQCAVEDRVAKTPRKQKVPKQRALISSLCIVCESAFASAQARKCCSTECRTLRALKLGAARSPKDSSPRPCKQCGAVFAPLYRNFQRQYCSKPCAKRANGFGKNHRSRARHYGIAYEAVDRVRIFRRDLWRCQICGVKTPERLMGTIEKRAPELDHRIPMARGGGHT